MSFFLLSSFFFYFLACLLFPNIDERMKIKTGLVYLLPLNQQLSCEIDSIHETLMILSNDTQLKIGNHFSLKCWELNPDFIEGLEGPCYRTFCLAYIKFKSRFIFDNKEIIILVTCLILIFVLMLSDFLQFVITDTLWTITASKFE